jgi:U3 small nucleolar RNA-associated protein 22
MHAVHTRYPCASATVRLARKWVASHLLSGMFPMEAIELIIAKAFTDPAPLATPGSVAAGFLRFLFLLSSHDFANQPFIVDPQGHLTRSDYENIFAHFKNCRGDGCTKGPPMYIITPNDRKEMKKSNEKHYGGAFFPTFTITHPEQVILSRAAALAKRSFSYLLSYIASGLEPEVGAVFLESPQSLRSFSALLRVDPAILVDSACSSIDGDFAMSTNQNGQIETPFMKSYKRRINGPKALRKTTYKNLTTAAGEGLLQEWQPISHLVQSLRSKFGDKAVFFFNELSPDIIALLWRPDTFKPGPLSALHSENKRPIEIFWHSDSLVVTNQDDILTEIEHMCQPVVLEVKVLDDRLMMIKSDKSLKRQKLPRRHSEEFISDSSD